MDKIRSIYPGKIAKSTPQAVFVPAVVFSTMAISLLSQSSALAVLPGLPFMQKTPPVLESSKESPRELPREAPPRDNPSETPREAAPKDPSPIKDQPAPRDPHNLPKGDPQEPPHDSPLPKDGSKEIPKDLPRDPRDQKDLPKETPREPGKAPLPPTEAMPRSHDRPWIDARPDLPL